MYKKIISLLVISVASYSIQATEESTIDLEVTCEDFTKPCRIQNLKRSNTIRDLKKEIASGGPFQFIYIDFLEIFIGSQKTKDDDLISKYYKNNEVVTVKIDKKSVISISFIDKSNKKEYSADFTYNECIDLKSFKEKIAKTLRIKEEKIGLLIYQDQEDKFRVTKDSSLEIYTAIQKRVPIEVVMKEDTFSITLRNMEGVSVIMDDVTSETTIRQLKHHLAIKKGYNIDNITIFSGGTRIDNECNKKELSDYNIVKKCTLQFVVSSSPNSKNSSDKEEKEEKRRVSINRQKRIQNLEKQRNTTDDSEKIKKCTILINALKKEEKKETFPIIFKLATGKEIISYNATSETKISELKDYLVSEGGFDFRTVGLLSHGKKLANDKKLIDYNIDKEHNTIFITIAIRGYPKNPSDKKTFPIIFKTLENREIIFYNATGETKISRLKKYLNNKIGVDVRNIKLLLSNEKELANDKALIAYNIDKEYTISLLISHDRYSKNPSDKEEKEEKKEDTFSITLRNMEGVSVIMDDVTSETTIRQLKHHLAIKKGYNIDNITIFSGGTRIDNECNKKELSDYNIVKKCTLQFVVSSSPNSKNSSDKTEDDSNENPTQPWYKTFIGKGFIVCSVVGVVSLICYSVYKTWKKKQSKSVRSQRNKAKNEAIYL